jgi:micrococcal nuclease
MMARKVMLAGLCAALLMGSSPPGAQSFHARGRALDGDTIAVDIRLLGIDAFETRQMCERRNGCWPCGKAQDLAARALRDAEPVITLTPSSTYGRPVATVTVRGSDLGETLLRAGLAIPQSQYLRRDPARRARYEAAFADAQGRRAGAFDGTWLPPARWRKGERLACERR